MKNPLITVDRNLTKDEYFGLSQAEQDERKEHVKNKIMQDSANQVKAEKQERQELELAKQKAEELRRVPLMEVLLNLPEDLKIAYQNVLKAAENFSGSLEILESSREEHSKVTNLEVRNLFTQKKGQCKSALRYLERQNIDVSIAHSDANAKNSTFDPKTDRILNDIKKQFSNILTAEADLSQVIGQVRTGNSVLLSYILNWIISDYEPALEKLVKSTEKGREDTQKSIRASIKEFEMAQNIYAKAVEAYTQQELKKVLTSLQALELPILDYNKSVSSFTGFANKLEVSIPQYKLLSTTGINYSSKISKLLGDGFNG